jgi:hypothetical protein
VEMVRLNRKVNDLEPTAAATIGRVDDAAHRRENVLRTKRAAEQTQSDVLGIVRTMLRPRSMRRRTPLPRFAPSAAARATPPIQESQCELPRVIPCHTSTLLTFSSKLNVGTPTRVDLRS